MSQRQNVQASVSHKLGRLRRNPLLAIGFGLGLLLMLAAIMAPWVSPKPADAGSAVHLESTLLPPSWSHPFGTDQLGRDLLTRVLYGARVSLRIAFLVLLLGCLVGVPLGTVAGYFGGRIDNTIMRVVDVFLAFPPLLLALALVAVLTPSAGSATIALAVAWWPWYARLARGQAASVAGRQLVESCRALGLSDARIVFRHVLPNAVTPIIVQASLDLGGVILVAAAMSFLGLGAQDPTPEWGLMISQGRSYFTTHWWVVTFPGAAILLAGMAFNLIGDGLREVLDPRRVVRMA